MSRPLAIVTVDAASGHQTVPLRGSDETYVLIQLAVSSADLSHNSTLVSWHLSQDGLTIQVTPFNEEVLSQAGSGPPNQPLPLPEGKDMQVEGVASPAFAGGMTTDDVYDMFVPGDFVSDRDQDGQFVGLCPECAYPEIRCVCGLVPHDYRG